MKVLYSLAGDFLETREPPPPSEGRHGVMTTRRAISSRCHPVHPLDVLVKTYIYCANAPDKCDLVYNVNEILEALADAFGCSKLDIQLCLDANGWGTNITVAELRDHLQKRRETIITAGNKCVDTRK
jgi:hypothetical protein